MGRPLKIAKAQAILTLTATTAATGAVTVSQSLAQYNVIPGMPFVVATTTGGLTAGTTYWILTQIDDHNFTVSATPLNANTTRTAVTLTDAGPVTVALTVAPVDTGFNNPNGSSSTYGVVGGNTGIYGPQVSVNVAIGVNGPGKITSNTASDIVFGANTDFANSVSAGTAIQAADGTNLGFVSAVNSLITLAITDTVATGSFVVTSGNAETLTLDQPVVFTGNLGGLSSTSVYYVQNIANATHFTVATQPAGTAYKVVTATGTVNAIQDSVTLTANALASYDTATNWVLSNHELGYINRQKGKQKYLVTGLTSGLTAQCVTANAAAAALTPNTMNITATYANSSTGYVESLSDYNSLVFGNTAPVLQNAQHVVASFNGAANADPANGINYPVVTITNS